MRARCRHWLVPWEPRPTGAPPTPEDRASFVARCAARERERQLGSGYGFGIFVGDRLAGEITLSSIQRGPFQNAFVGYWVDEAMAGKGLAPEATVVVLRFAFEELALHRVEIAIVPRNRPSRRVVEKLSCARKGWPCATWRSTGGGRTMSATPSRPRSGWSVAVSSFRPGSARSDVGKDDVVARQSVTAR